MGCWSSFGGQQQRNTVVKFTVRRREASWTDGGHDDDDDHDGIQSGRAGVDLGTCTGKGQKVADLCDTIRVRRLGVWEYNTVVCCESTL